LGVTVFRWWLRWAGVPLPPFGVSAGQRRNGVTGQVLSGRARAVSVAASRPVQESCGPRGALHPKITAVAQIRPITVRKVT
jgi:hypothetical protein